MNSTAREGVQIYFILTRMSCLCFRKEGRRRSTREKDIQKNTFSTTVQTLFLPVLSAAGQSWAADVIITDGHLAKA